MPSLRTGTLKFKSSLTYCWFAANKSRLASGVLEELFQPILYQLQLSFQPKYQDDTFFPLQRRPCISLEAKLAERTAVSFASIHSKDILHKQILIIRVPMPDEHLLLNL